MNRTEIAAQYRAESGHQSGVVIIGIDGEVGGWMNELRSPEHWMPGCIAIDADGNEWQATGGNDYDGATHWEPLKKPPYPMTYVDEVTGETVELIVIGECVIKPTDTDLLASLRQQGYLVELTEADESPTRAPESAPLSPDQP